MRKKKINKKILYVTKVIIYIFICITEEKFFLQNLIQLKVSYIT